MADIAKLQGTNLTNLDRVMGSLVASLSKIMGLTVSGLETILLINTTNVGATSDNQFRLPLSSGGVYDFYVDWGDGTGNKITSYNQAEVTHTYAQYGMYAIRIKGVLNGWSFNNGGDRLKLLSVVDFGKSLLLPNVAGFMYGASWLCDAPTEISSWTQLAAIQNYGCYKLTRSLTTADADYATVAGPAANGGAGWNPIAAFSGTLDGMGFSLDGLTINRPSTDTVGLFATAGGGLVVSNLNLTNVSVTGRDVVGALFGNGSGSPVRVINCTVQGSVAGRDRVGGFCGQYVASASNSCRFLRCTVSGTVTGTTQCGGFWGYTGGSELFVESCISHAAVTGTNYVGGLGGYNNTGSHYFYYSFATGLVTGSTNKGGLIGKRINGFSWAVRSYWDTQGTGQAAAGDTPTGGDAYVGLTTAQMQGANAPVNMPYLGWVNIYQQETGYPSIRIQNRPAYTPAVRAPLFAAGITTIVDAFRGTRLKGASLNVGVWNTSNITNMSSTFRSSTLFKQNIGMWNVESCTNFADMFNGCDINETGNTTNYDALLVGWSAQNVALSQSFHGGTSKYSAGIGAPARLVLTGTKLWTITDGGQA